MLHMAVSLTAMSGAIPEAVIFLMEICLISAWEHWQEVFLMNVPCMIATIIQMLHRSLGKMNWMKCIRSDWIISISQ